MYSNCHSTSAWTFLWTHEEAFLLHLVRTWSRTGKMFFYRSDCKTTQTSRGNISPSKICFLAEAIKNYFRCYFSCIFRCRLGNGRKFIALIDLQLFKAGRRCAYLNSGFGEIDFHGNFFARVNVRVMRLLKRPFKLFQLCRRESCSYPSLFSLLTQHWIMPGVDFVRKASWNETQQNEKWIHFQMWIKQLGMKVSRQICVTPFVKHEKKWWRRRKEDIFVVFITSSSTLRQGKTFSFFLGNLCLFLFVYLWFIFLVVPVTSVDGYFVFCVV